MNDIVPTPGDASIKLKWKQERKGLTTPLWSFKITLVVFEKIIKYKGHIKFIAHINKMHGLSVKYLETLISFCFRILTSDTLYQ